MTTTWTVLGCLAVLIALATAVAEVLDRGDDE